VQGADALHFSAREGTVESNIKHLPSLLTAEDSECSFIVPPWYPDHGKHVVRRPRVNNLLVRGIRALHILAHGETRGRRKHKKVRGGVSPTLRMENYTNNFRSLANTFFLCLLLTLSNPKYM